MTTKKLIIRISYCFLLFLLGIWFPKLRAYADCPFPAQQDASISATCTISTTTGIDVAANETSTTNTGKVTIGADTTINNGGTLTTGSLQIVSGTTISIQDGGQIKMRTPLYASDSTCDGYADDLNNFYTATGSGKRRLFFLKSMNQTKFSGTGLDGPVTISANKNINTDVLVGNGPVSWWKIDEAAGTSVADSKGTNTGTATGTTVVAGKYSNARDFSGSAGNYVSVPAATGTLDIESNPVTIEAWIYPHSTGTQVIFSRGQSGTNGYGIRILSGKLNIGFHGGGNFSGATSLTPNNWWHVAGVINGASAVAYVNGQQDATGSASVVASALDGYIGADWNGTTQSSLFDGVIDDVRIFNNARTQEQIQYDMTSNDPFRSSADGVQFTSITNTSAGSTTINLNTPSAPTGLAVGDDVIIINLQGTSAGQYELKKIASINTNTLTFTNALVNNYDGTTQKIMIQRVPN